MMKKNLHPKRIISLDLHRLSFGFVVFEGPDKLLDWGVKSFRNGVNAVKIPFYQKLNRLVEDFDPEGLVVKVPCRTDMSTKVRAVQMLARARRISVLNVPPEVLRKHFPGHNRNKHQIATYVANRLPELASMLPAKRKPWQSEHYRMSVFEAAAVGLVHLPKQTTNSRIKDSGSFDGLSVDVYTEFGPPNY
jgi:hypothetical protein